MQSFTVTPVYDLLLRGDSKTPVGVFQLQIATADQLCRLHYKPGMITTIKARMKTMTEYGYVQLDAVPVKVRHEHKVSFSPRYYYTLGPQGWRYLAHLGLDVHPAWRASKEVDKHGLFIEHTLELNDLLIAAALLNQVEPRFQLDIFTHERVWKRNPMKVKLPTGRIANLVPDASLVFHLSGTELRLRLYLEHDRGTEDQEYFRRKIRMYITLLKSSLAAELKVKTIAFTTFVSEQRLQQMRTWTEQELQVTKEPFEIVSAFTFAYLPLPVTPQAVWVDASWQLAYAGSKPHSLLA